MRQKSLHLHLFSLVLRFTGDPEKCNSIVNPVSYSIQAEWKSPQIGWNLVLPAYCWIPSSVFPNHIPPLLYWVPPKGSTLNQLTSNILLCLSCTYKFHGTMDLFLRNLIWVILGNISILKRTHCFHCTYTLLLTELQMLWFKGTQPR